MKKTLLTLGIAIASYCSYAQQIGTSPIYYYGGNVGVGTTSPDNLLTAYAGNGTIAFKALSAGINSSANVGKANYGIGEINQFRAFMQTRFVWNGSYSDGEIGFTTLQGGVSQDERLTIKGNGNVGIGTTSPTAKLQIETTGNTDPNGSMVSSNIDAMIIGANGYGQSAISTRQYDSTNQPASGDTQFLNLFYNGSTYNWYERMRIRANGNVLIGQTTQVNSAYKLDIAGDARANKIVVNTSGADFVFEPEYKLPELSNVKSYIKQNHHLPQIPSALEMQKEGMNVGELNTKLLQKVEELTLYLIEQKEATDKQNKIQQQQINQLKEQLDKLSERIK